MLVMGLLQIKIILLVNANNHMIIKISKKKYQIVLMLGKILGIIFFFSGVGMSIVADNRWFFLIGVLLAWILNYPIIRGVLAEEAD